MSEVRKYNYKTINNEDSILELRYYRKRYEKSFSWIENGVEHYLWSDDEDADVTAWTVLCKIYKQYKNCQGLIEFEDKYTYVELDYGYPLIKVKINVKVDNNIIEINIPSENELIVVDTSIPFNLLEVMTSIVDDERRYYTIDNQIELVKFYNTTDNPLCDFKFQWTINGKTETFYNYYHCEEKDCKYINNVWTCGNNCLERYNKLINIYEYYKTYEGYKTLVRFDSCYEGLTKDKLTHTKHFFKIEIRDNIFTVIYEDGLIISVDTLNKFNLIEQMKELINNLY